MGSDASSPLRLARPQRLKQGRDFARARVEGRRLAQGCLVLNWLPLRSAAPSRVGVVTGRKLGNAVVRSRARRLLRECFRLHQHQLAQPADVVLVARQSIVGKGFAEVESDFLAAVRKARLLRAKPAMTAKEDRCGL